MKKTGIKMTVAALLAALVFPMYACQKPISTESDLTFVGPSACTVSEGYADFSTDAFTVTGMGDDDFAAFQAEGDARITWNDGTGRLDIAAGLPKGDYAVALTAMIDRANGEQEIRTRDFTLHVVLPPVASGAPHIAGVAYGEAQTGYAAFTTDRFTLSGTGVHVAVTNVCKNGAAFDTDAFTWQASERRLRVAAGLGVGQYTVTLSASSAVYVADYDFIYAFTVNAPVMPLLEGPDSAVIAAGYTGGTVDGFMAIGTNARMTVTASNKADDSAVSGIAYDAAANALTVAAGLDVGEYAVNMRLHNGDPQYDAVHELTLSVVEGFAVTGTFEYASGWYTDGAFANTADTVTATVASADGRFDYPVTVGADGTFRTELVAGDYVLTLHSTQFCDVTEPITVGAGGDATDVQSIFTVPKLENESGNGFAYTQDGFTVPYSNTVFRPIAGATATEGFTVRYTMATTHIANKWISGGFCFRIGTVWYSMLVYPSQNVAGRARIFLTQGVNNTFTNGFYFATSKELLGGSQAIDVEIAYYDEAFYLRIDGDYAVRVGRELFSTDRTCKTNACPVYLGDVQYGIFTNPSSAGKDYATVSPNTFLGAGERVLGLRAVDYTNTFTDVRYALGNDAAKALIQDMATTAAAMEKQPCADNAWPQFTEA